MKKILFAALAATTLFASCAKENSTKGPGNGQGLTDPTYVTFAFKNGTVSRAGATSDTDNGDLEADAKKIKDVRLLIFNANTKALEVNEAVTMTAGKVTKLVTPGQKKMYVIANVSSNSAMDGALSALTTNSTLDDFLALTYTATGTPGQRPSEIPEFSGHAVSTNFSITELAHMDTDEGFPMSSTDALTYTFAANVTEAAASGGTATTAATSATNSFQINLEFMLAKVGVAKADPMTVTNGSVADLKFAVRNIAAKTYITQQFAGTSVKSFYHSMFDASTTQATYNAHFDYSADATVPVLATPGFADGAGNYIYAAENTNQSLRVGQATYVAVKANFIPAKVQKESEIEWDERYAAGSKLVLGAGTSGTANTTFVVLKRALNHGSIPAGTYFESVAAVEKAIALQDSDGNSTTYTGTPANDYDVYTNGVSWYRINIGDSSVTPTKYGVERGKQYQVSINRITGPGFNHEDLLIEGPKIPLSEQTYISATIVAKGWTTVTQGTDI